MLIFKKNKLDTQDFKGIEITIKTAILNVLASKDQKISPLENHNRNVTYFRKVS